MKERLLQQTSKSFSGQGMFSDDKKSYFKIYNDFLFYIMEYETTKDNMNHNFDTFSTLKLLGTDPQNAINEIEAIDFNTYIQINLDNESKLFNYINQINITMNEYKNKSKKESGKGTPEYIFNLILINLHNNFTKNDYTNTMHSIIQYLFRTKNILNNITYEKYLINGDFSLDILMNKNNNKLLLHDWNASKSEAYELELAIFLINIYFHCKNKSLVHFDVNFDNLNNFIKNNIDFQNINFDLFKFYVVYALIRGGYLITCEKVCEKVKTIDDLLNELSNFIINDSDILQNMPKTTLLYPSQSQSVSTYPSQSQFKSSSTYPSQFQSSSTYPSQSQSQSNYKSSEFSLGSLLTNITNKIKSLDTKDTKDNKPIIQSNDLLFGGSKNINYIKFNNLNELIKFN
jgi:hypothetical protein